MESPATLPDSPMDQDETLYPCKGCNEILEEGKAFELAGNRWHIDCFRCNSCRTLLDSDANLLLLGDGSLICNNCTYSCNACGNKIEDLAILTGDQAFCASCFRCRNCKRKIDNLKYARTSQGIFCMSCHESLMARRRKKSRAASSSQKAGSSAQSPMLLDKSLPSLPPPGGPQAPPMPSVGTPSETYDDNNTDYAPSSRPQTGRNDSSMSVGRQDSIPDGSSKGEWPPVLSTFDHVPDAEVGAATDGSTLPPPSQSSERGSAISHGSEQVNGEADHSNSFNITMVLDTGPGPAPGVQSSAQTPRSGSTDRARQHSGSRQNIGRPGEREYPNGGKGTRSRPLMQERQARPPRSSSRDSEAWSTSSNHASPHVAFQERGRVPSADAVEGLRSKERLRKDVDPGAKLRAPPVEVEGDDLRAQDGTSSRPGPDMFQLQEVPKSRKSGILSRNTKSATQSPIERKPSPVGVSRSLSASNSGRAAEQQGAAMRTDSLTSLAPQKSDASPRPSTDSRGQDEDVVAAPTGAAHPLSTHKRPTREDSMPGAEVRRALPRKDVSSEAKGELSPGATRGSDAQAGSLVSKSSDTARAASNGYAPSFDQSQPETSDFPLPPPRARDHTALGKSPHHDPFSTPRAPPLPPTAQLQSREGSGGAIQMDSARPGDNGPGSPGLLQYERSDDLNMEADMARILGQNDESSNSIMRRVSNAVRHGRSFSDMETRARSSGKWSRSPATNGASGSPYAPEISSPTSVSPEAREENLALKHELRRSAQKIAELEARVNSTADIDTLDTKLREKRSTVAFLDTQKEIMVRELEVLTEHVADAKKTGRPIDVEALPSKIAREFAVALEHVKNTYAPEVEDLIHRKNILVEENANLLRLRDQAIQETEQLNLKNAQLADLNNELTQQIQERYRAHREQQGGFDGSRGQTNGLGIFQNHQKDRSDSFGEGRESRSGQMYHASASASGTQASLADQNDAEPATVLTAPHVINIRKGQAKKFNWKKGGQSVAKGVSKGFKGAFSSTAQQQNYQYSRDGRDGPLQEGTPYGMHTPAESPSSGISRPYDANKQGLGFFSHKLAKGAPSRLQSNGNLVTMTAESAQTLFGSELVERAEYERRQIPSVVTRCIEEVELRGMDIEGIYRKTGGNSQVKALQEGFERTDDYDISDPGLDITAVTSVLKQYFRRLPTPLLTFDVYDGMLESNSIPDEEQRALFMQSLLQQLPTKHRDCLEFLVFHLARVATREKENLMTPKNLAVVFAPTIMRDISLDREMSDMHIKNSAIQFLIEHNKSIFTT
ncbi:MAG: hypothetical protein M1825_000896 [Sarcosagium campestre]|nr:MAG: hypothetical protein M1825_000896 [Sarcosagium campestre]